MTTGELEKILEKKLMNLSSRSFKSFKSKLMNCKVPKQYDRIPWNKLQNAEPEDTVNLIIRYYTTKHGPETVRDVLKQINERQLMQELKTELKKYFKRKHQRHQQCKRRQEDGDGETIPTKKIKCDGSAEYSLRMERCLQKDQIKKVSYTSAQVPLSHAFVSAATLTPEIFFISNTSVEYKIIEHSNICVKEEASEIGIATPSARDSNKQQQQNISLSNHSAVKCLEKKSTNKGPTSGYSNVGVGKLDSRAKNISQVQETTEYNKQSGKPALSHSPNVQCSPTEPRPRTATNSFSTAKNVPALHNKISPHKSDCTQQYHVPKCIPPRGKPLQDMLLRVLNKKNLEALEANHEGKPHIFAKLLFQFYVPYALYTNWVKNTNFDGFGGKNAIPNNLREAILKQIKYKFELQKEDKKKIRKTINDLLTRPRKTGWPIQL